MTYKTEFPNFPAADMPAIPAGFADQSWRDDASPSFLHEAAGLVLWVNEADPAAREIPEAPRFQLWQCIDRDPVHGWQLTGGEVCLLASEDWKTMANAILHFEADMADEMEVGTPQKAARTIRMRLGLGTADDARLLLSEELRAAKPSPDFIGHLHAMIYPGQPETTDKLADEYDQWTAEHFNAKRGELAAEDLQAELAVTMREAPDGGRASNLPELYDWLSCFIIRWDAAQAREDFDSALAARGEC